MRHVREFLPPLVLLVRASMPINEHKKDCSKICQCRMDDDDIMEDLEKRYLREHIRLLLTVSGAVLLFFVIVLATYLAGWFT